MCIDADVDCAATAGIGVVGTATPRHVDPLRVVLFARVPLFFAPHRSMEAFV